MVLVRPNLPNIVCKSWLHLVIKKVFPSRPKFWHATRFWKPSEIVKQPEMITRADLESMCRFTLVQITQSQGLVFQATYLKSQGWYPQPRKRDPSISSIVWLLPKQWIFWSHINITTYQEVSVLRHLALMTSPTLSRYLNQWTILVSPKKKKN